MLIVDDQAVIRSELRRLVEPLPAFDVVAEAGDGAEAVAEARTHQPDVVLMDVRMPHVDGIVATAHLMSFTAPPKVLIMTGFDIDDRVLDALEAGACGFLMKDLSPGQLETAMRTALVGGRVMAPEALDSLVRRASAAGHARGASARAWLTQLSGSERRVLALIGAGLTNAQIARQLHLSQASVKTYVSRALTKLGLENRTQAAILAYEAGLVGVRGDDLGLRGKA
ncbi:response regulator transcription factor [Streptomyces sp. H27-D2]|uniref:response regulator transcription factor n=1 Tax=Streptomyces sp. H27-D2 TaxID=3046304 RepID=UPI002DB8386C|nr:response regulator transcription factor [Streptomyces sp. H27-D2]MEC4017963.1 response regulator transcription factor [Streptomyces sp. H27-D2]